MEFRHTKVLQYTTTDANVKLADCTTWRSSCTSSVPKASLRVAELNHGIVDYPNNLSRDWQGVYNARAKRGQLCLEYGF